MLRKGTTAYAAVEGSLALQPQRAYQQAAERYSRRKAQPHSAKASKRGVRLKTIFAILLIVAAIYVLLMRQISIQEEVLSLAQLRSELKEEQRRREDLRLELSLKMDIDQVQRVAREELNMNYPAAEMTRPIVLPPIKTGSTAEMANSPISDNVEEPVTIGSWLKKMRDQLSR